MRDPEAMIERQAYAQVVTPFRTIRKLYGFSCEGFREVLYVRLRNFLREHPMRAATREQTAIHEAGHLISFEMQEMVAEYARLEGASFGHGGWGGAANCWERPSIGPKADARNLLRDARCALAGPVAEELLGGGDVFGSVGELIDARVLINFAARQVGYQPDALAREELLSVANAIEINATALLSISDQLARKREIRRRHFEKNLAGLNWPRKHFEISDRAEVVVHRIERVFGFGPLRKKIDVEKFNQIKAEAYDYE